MFETTKPSVYAVNVTLQTGETSRTLYVSELPSLAYLKEFFSALPNGDFSDNLAMRNKVNAILANDDVEYFGVVVSPNESSYVAKFFNNPILRIDVNRYDVFVQTALTLKHGTSGQLKTVSLGEANIQVSPNTTDDELISAVAQELHKIRANPQNITQALRRELDRSNVKRTVLTDRGKDRATTVTSPARG